MARPRGSTAPTAVRVSRAAAIAPPGGGSSSASPEASGSPQQAAWSANAVRSATLISGAGNGGSRPSSASAQHRYTAPGASRPARPARCRPAAREDRTVVRPLSPRAWSTRGSRASPASTTTRTPGTVSDDSATEVASTTRRRSAGDSTASCTAAGARPCTWSTSTAPRSPSSPATRAISPTPGRKQSTSPGRSASARRTTDAVWASSAGSTRIPCGGRTGRAGGAHTTSTGWETPAASTTGAPPSSRAHPCASVVAEAATSRSSGRSVPRTSSRKAAAVSASRCRSWHSSSTTASIPGSSWSRWSRCNSTPVVTTSTRAWRPTTRSPRTVNPMSPPTSWPSSHAIRRAAARAAIRRGSATSTRRAGPPPTRPASTSGTRVVLPVPGGATSTAAPWSSRASFRAGRAPRTGSASRASSRITPPSVVRRRRRPPRARGGRSRPHHSVPARSRSHTKIAVPGISRPRSGDQPPHSEVFQDGHSGSTRSTSRKPEVTMSLTRSPSVLWCST